MQKIQLRNDKGLVIFLSSHRCNYKIINDGWSVELIVNSYQELFNIGKMYGDYLANNQHLTLVTIEELEQRGDLPTA